jgi:hypothetical protein
MGNDQPVIRVENLGKRYFLGEFDHNRRLRSQFARWTREALSSLFARNGKPAPPPASTPPPWKAAFT